MPPGAKPLPLPYSALNGPSLLQSCGTFRLRQLPSSNAGIIAAAKSPLEKSQFASKSSVKRASAAGERTGSAKKKKAATTVEKIFRNFIKGLTRSFVKR